MILFVPQVSSRPGLLKIRGEINKSDTVAASL